MSYETLLFVGGSADGRRIDVYKNTPFITVPHKRKPSLSSTPHSASKPELFESDLYRRETLFSAGNRDHFVMHYAEGGDLIEMLIDGYKKEIEE